MTQMLRTTLAFAAAAVIAALATSFLARPVEQILEENGYYDAAPGFFARLVAWLVMLPSQHSFQIILAGVIGLAVGAWSHYVLTKSDNASLTEELPQSAPASSSPAVEFMALRHTLSRAESELWNGIKEHGSYNFHRINEDTRISLNVLYARLRKIGIITPKTDGYAKPYHYNLTHAGYLQRVTKYSSSGLIDEANEEIDRFLKEQNKAIEEDIEIQKMPNSLRPTPPRR